MTQVTSTEAAERLARRRRASAGKDPAHHDEGIFRFDCHLCDATFEFPKPKHGTKGRFGKYGRNHMHLWTSDGKTSVERPTLCAECLEAVKVLGIAYVEGPPVVSGDWSRRLEPRVRGVPPFDDDVFDHATKLFFELWEDGRRLDCRVLLDGKWIISPVDPRAPLPRGLGCWRMHVLPGGCDVEFTLAESPTVGYLKRYDEPLRQVMLKFANFQEAAAVRAFVAMGVLKPIFRESSCDACGASLGRCVPGCPNDGPRWFREATN